MSMALEDDRIAPCDQQDENLINAIDETALAS